MNDDFGLFALGNGKGGREQACWKEGGKEGGREGGREGGMERERISS